MTKFVILAAPRTGSYLLVDLLKQQKGVICYGEIYKKNVVEIAPEYRERLGAELMDVARRDADPLGFYNRLYERTPDDITGFKVFRAHGKAVVQSLLLNSSVKKVFLSRNPVQSYISLRMAQVTEKWTNRTNPEGTKTAKLTISLYNLIRHISEQKSWSDICRNASLLSKSDFLFLDYADLFDAASREKLAKFLGMERWDDSIKPTTHKQITKDYGEVVANWKKLNKFLQDIGTGVDDRFIDFTNRFSGVPTEDAAATRPATAGRREVAVQSAVA